MQDKIKRYPDLYKKEFLKHMDIFKEKLLEFKSNPAKRNSDVEEYMKFLSHVRYVGITILDIGSV